MPFASSQRSTPSTLATMESSTSTAKFVATSSRILFIGWLVLLCASLDWGPSAKFQYRPGALLGDDVRGGVGVAGGDPRHDRRVDDPQAVDSVDPQLVVHHRHGIVAHLAGADRVEDRGSEL